MKKMTLLIAVTSLFLTVPAVAFADDAMHYWTFNEGTGRSVGDVAGGQNGVMVGSSTDFGWTSGKVGTGIVMDGTMGTGVALPDAFLKGSTGSFSVWLKLDSLSDRNIIFSSKSTTDHNIYNVFSVDREGRIQLQFRDTASGNDRKAQGTKILNVNEWYHIVFTANAQSYQLFVNGEVALVAGENTGRWIPDLSNHVMSHRIGISEATPFSGSFDGYLDDFRIYNRALSSTDVGQLYNEGNNAVPTVPIAVAPKIAFTISEDHVPFGGSVSLDWTTVNINTCTASGGWSGEVPTSGSRVMVKIPSDTTYTLNCVGKYGTDVASVTVHIGTTTPKGQGSLVSSVVSPVFASSTKITGLALARNVSHGLRGDDVKQLQIFLIKKGYLIEAGSTGYFGPLTKAGLIKYQKEKGLPQTGFCGPMTRKALSEE